MRQPLIDSDVLLYECGFGAESSWEGPGFPSFDYVMEMLDNKIGNICAMVEATHPPILFLTGKGNFRYDIAKRQPYKERPSNKPFHYNNLKAYIKAKYEYRESVGMEADDLMAIEQTERMDETIICTRDKDLRAVPGWHYGWEMGNQPSFGPEFIYEQGYIKLSNDRKSIKGTGSLFFYSQLLTGDKVDTIPGLDGIGAVKAFKILEGSVDSKDAYFRVLDAYLIHYGETGEAELLEQGRLLHMTREIKNGKAVMWEIPYVDTRGIKEKFRF